MRSMFIAGVVLSLSLTSFANQTGTVRGLQLPQNATTEQTTQNPPSQSTNQTTSNQATNNQATTKQSANTQSTNTQATNSTTNTANTTKDTTTKDTTKDTAKDNKTDPNATDSKEPIVDNIPANPHDPNAPTMLDALSPDESELSRANTELLAKNAELSRHVDDLSTQVNVLVQERSGQLFIYGVVTALMSLIIGFILGKLSNRQRW